jgi:hypothetical protein
MRAEASRKHLSKFRLCVAVLLVDCCHDEAMPSQLQQTVNTKLISIQLLMLEIKRWQGSFLLIRQTAFLEGWIKIRSV